MAAEAALLVEVVAEDECRWRRAFDDLERSAELSDVLLFPGTFHGLVVRRRRVDLDVLANGKILEHAALLVELGGVDAAHVVGVSSRDLNVGRGVRDDGGGVNLLFFFMSVSGGAHQAPRIAVAGKARGSEPVMTWNGEHERLSLSVMFQAHAIRWRWTSGWS